MRITVDNRGIVESNPEESTTLFISGTMQIKPAGGSATNLAGVIVGVHGNPATGTPRQGTRPAASSCTVGTTWVAADDRIHWSCVAKPSDPTTNIWVPSAAPSTRTVVSIVGGPSSSIASRFGYYNPTINRFTPVTASGQFANATAGTAGTSGSSLFVVLFPATAGMGLSPWTGALSDEFMCDQTGSAVPYINNGTNIALGIGLVAPGVTTTLALLMYEY